MDAKHWGRRVDPHFGYLRTEFGCEIVDWSDEKLVGNERHLSELDDRDQDRLQRGVRPARDGHHPPRRGRSASDCRLRLGDTEAAQVWPWEPSDDSCP